MGVGTGVSAGEKRMTVHDDRDVGFNKLDVGGEVSMKVMGLRACEGRSDG